MAAKLIANEFRSMLRDPIEGLAVEIPDESNIFEWKVYIEGPKDTCYEGGLFQLLLSFPAGFPMDPPSVKFVSEFWHPNVYREGNVCISILHPPGEDPMSGELASERWLPSRSVASILLSIISMLSSPNLSSPANVDSSVEWRDYPHQYSLRVARLVAKANPKNVPHIKIPHPDSNPVERAVQIERIREMNKPIDMEDLMYEEEEEEDMCASSEGYGASDIEAIVDEEDLSTAEKMEVEAADAKSSRASSKVKGATDKKSHSSRDKKCRKKNEGKKKKKKKQADDQEHEIAQFMNPRSSRPEETVSPEVEVQPGVCVLAPTKRRRKRGKCSIL